MRKYLLIAFVALLSLSLLSMIFSTHQELESSSYTIPADGSKLVAVTYNIRGCRDDNGVADVEAIARELKKFHPDIVALQEVDEGLPRSGFVHQAEALAELLHMHYAYSPSIHFVIGSYGNAILSKYPILSEQSYKLPYTQEPRSLLKAQIDFAGKPLSVYATHLGTTQSERVIQMKALYDDLKKDKPKHTTILLGDFNTDQRDPLLRPLHQLLTDPMYNQHEHFATVEGQSKKQIDNIFTSQDFALSYATTTTRSRSDHNPVCYHLKISSQRT